MALRPTAGSENALHRELEAFAARTHEATIHLLTKLGDQAATIARRSTAYRDNTGNLRGSVGYLVAYNGAVVQENFSAGSGGVTGADYARGLLSAYPTGYALLLVAGMRYASKVESTGRDVLTSAELYLEANLPLLLTQLKAQL